MGPLSEESGESDPFDDGGGDDGGASMGPLSEESGERSTPQPRVLQGTRFNGAAL